MAELRVLNALSCFLVAWVLVSAAIETGADLLLSAGGAVLLLTATLYVARSDDPMRRVFDAIPDGMPWSNVPRGRPRDVLVVTVFAVLGLSCLTGGLVGAV